MADKVIVTKSKLTGLGDKIRAKTGSTDKMTIDAMNAALDNVGGLKVIEVQELPTENIDENAIYKIPRKLTDVAVIYNSDYGNGPRNYIDFLSFSTGIKIIGLETVQEKPTENIKSSSLATYEIYFYYVKSEQDLFLYGNIGMGDSWYTYGQVIQFINDVSMSFKGEYYCGLTNTEAGYYAYFEDEKYYQYINKSFVECFGNLQITLNKQFNQRWLPQNPKIELINYKSDLLYDNFEFSKYKHIRITNIFKFNNKFNIENSLLNGSEVETLHLIHTDKDVIFSCTSDFFQGDKLTKLIIDFGEFADLTILTPLLDCPINNGTGYIYIPDNKVEEVKLLNGWSTYANQIKPLSEYVEE